MKNLVLTFLFASFTFIATAQKDERLPVVFVNKDISTHFISSQKFDYTDISTKNVVGDMPLANVLRIKPIKNFDDDLGVVTIVGEGFFVQYKMVYSPNSNLATKRINVEVNSKNEFNNPNYSMTSGELKNISSNIIRKQSKVNVVASKQYKMHIALNNIYTVGDYFFVDYTVLNKTNIKYDIDEIRYKIVDKKVSKSENNQSVEINSEYELIKDKSFKRKHRNVVVFKKFTFPDNKYFQIELSEKQISGRTITLNIAYSDILNADRP